jgi:NADPH-dependent 2,4-dienoyl-CoA reductase/sulfur reductase-like enzyme
MPKESYKYIIVGAGLAGASAVDGIREYDKSGPILLIGAEKHLPYNRPPLTKDLWWGTMEVNDIFVHDKNFYAQNGVELLLEARIVSLDADTKTVTDNQGRAYHYEKLLLATGGTPRMLSLPGGNLDGICYYRYLDDYSLMQQAAAKGTAVTIVGGGFIGSELAASLSTKDVKVTMIYPEDYVCARVFPEYLGKAVQAEYRKHGVTILDGDKPVSFEKSGGKFITRTQNRQAVASDTVVVGIGIAASSKLAESAGLRTSRSVVVNEYQQTSNPDVYAAGDNTSFPYIALGKEMHVEHWDHAVNQGKCAGRNMAGAHTPYDYMPDFFSDIYDFSYQAVGEVNSELKTIPDWQEENKKGTIYYVSNDTLRGVMFCNIPDKIDQARELIKKGAVPENLAAAIK